MSANELRDYIASLCSHVTFDFHGKSCGVDPLAPDQIDLWMCMTILSWQRRGPSTEIL